MVTAEEAEKFLGVSFRNKRLLTTALTHSSFRNEHRCEDLEDYERLEFLGDAVLELIASEFVFKECPGSDEGILTKRRMTLVRTGTLSECAKKMNLLSLVALGNGQKCSTMREINRILACVLEAVIGALYLDQGLVAARTFVHRTILSRLDELDLEERSIDPKSFLQERAQDILKVTPTYKLIEKKGTDHDSSFTAGVYFCTDLAAIGVGKSVQEAQQKAAESALVARGW